MEETKQANGNQRPRFGEDFKLPLSASRFLSFQKRRRLYWERRKQEIAERFDISLSEYVIKGGDTAAGIARSKGIDLWFLMEYNENIDPVRLSIDKRIIVPLLKEKIRRVEPPKREPLPTLEERTQVVGLTIKVRKGERIRDYLEWADGILSFEQLRRCNDDLSDPNFIRVGQTVYLPLTRSQSERFQRIRESFHAGKSSK